MTSSTRRMRCTRRLPTPSSNPTTYALAADESEGIWAGTLPDERREMQQAAA
ncbi:MAG TPA: hypothetical protein VKA25_07220 [Gemmatimonadales bacterium]|nr:hypothetical protein [Gemmatimonadales bacterium]